MAELNLNFASVSDLANIEGISPGLAVRIHEERSRQPFPNMQAVLARLPDLTEVEVASLRASTVASIPQDFDVPLATYFARLGDIGHDEVERIRDRLTDFRIQLSTPSVRSELAEPDPASDLFNLAGGFQFPSRWYDLNLPQLVTQIEVLLIGALSDLDHVPQMSDDAATAVRSIGSALAELDHASAAIEPLRDFALGRHMSAVVGHLDAARVAIAVLSAQLPAHALVLSAATANIGLAASLASFFGGLLDTLKKKKKALAKLGKGILKKIAVIITIAEFLYLLLKYGDHLQICIREALAQAAPMPSFWGYVRNCMSNRGISLGDPFWDVLEVLEVVAIKELILHC